MAKQGRSMAQRAAATILFSVATIGVVRAAIPLPATTPAPPPAVPVRLAATVALNPPHPLAVPLSPPRAEAPEPTLTAASTPAPLAIRRVIDTGGPIRYGHWFWEDTSAAGPVTITVDLKASVLSVFRGGDEIGTTAVIYGADDRETPLGTFPILQKDRHHFSSRYHHAPMPYMLRLTGDGVSIHASDVAADYATHGCIGVPAGFARKLFEAANVGDRVIVTNRGMRSA